MTQRPVASWAESQVTRRGLSIVLAGLCIVLLINATALSAQPGEPSQGHDSHDGASVSAWEGSTQGMAYSEFNHHFIGLLILMIGLSELRQALGTPFLAWTRFLLPGALLASGFFLFIWSDHDAWPIGSLGFMQTFFGSDSEIFQHKSYALLLLLVGVIELLRRVGSISHAVWITPLPLFAVIGGLMLFSHSHGLHPSAAKIALDHWIMGTMSVTAGSCKLLFHWVRSSTHKETSLWGLLWAGLILLIGVQLLLYSE